MSNIECERVQTLISAELDGELEGDEQTELHHHVRRCPACADFRRACSRVAFAYAEWVADNVEAESTPMADSLVQANGSTTRHFEGHLQRSDATGDTYGTAKVFPGGAEPGAVFHGVNQRPQPMPWRLRTWLSLAVAASLLVAAGTAVWWQMRRPPRPHFSLDPLLVGYASNVEAEQNQQSSLRIVEMDLRTMRLELDQLDLDEATRRQLKERIESLLAKTSQLSKTPNTFSGEMK